MHSYRKIKILALVTVLLSVSHLTWAQTLTLHQGQNINYIVTEDVLVPGITNTTLLQNLSVDQLSQRISYFDGLGRPVQHVLTQGSPGNKDIVVPVVYDAFGREACKYLPFTAEQNGRYKPTSQIIDNTSGNYIGIAANFYGNADGTIADAAGKPYAKTVFEPSPLNRIIKQGAPGDVWQPDPVNAYNSADHTVKNSYEMNAEHEVLQWTYSYPLTQDSLGLIYAGDGTSRIYYAANALFKHKIKDEQQVEMIQYTDKEGRLILKRTQATAGTPSVTDANYASTYYIYDDFGNLVCELPPEAVNRITESPVSFFEKAADEQAKFLRRWAFQYAYDNQGRMTIKQAPGVKPVYMIYDANDRLVMTQDGNQRAKETQEWTFIKYDAWNRPVLTGTYASNATPLSMQYAVNEFYESLSAGIAWFETYIGAATGSVFGYDNKSFPQVGDINQCLTVTYYDRYDSFMMPAAYAPVGQGLPGEVAATSDKKIGKITGGLVKNLSTGAWMRTVNFYDTKYRLIQLVSDHHKQGTIRVNSVYDFVGRILFTKRKYVVGTSETTVKESFTYDHAGRLMEVRHSINGAPDVLMVSSEYNELGQLITKRLHKTGQSGTPVTADPAVGQPGVLYGEEIHSSEFNSAQHTYIANKKVGLHKGFKVQISSGFKARIGFSEADAAAHNNNIVYTCLQTVNYRYNIRGWLTRINDPAAPSSDDLFNMELRYNNPTADGGVPQYNGNSSEVIWQSVGQDKQAYAYRYDNLNRLTEAKYYNVTTPVENGRYDEKIGDALLDRRAYDLNGNILNLFRNGKTASGASGLIDDLSYTYASDDNRLTAVSDEIATNAGEAGFKESIEGDLDYTYDANGNVANDVNKDIIAIEYNHFNLPSKVSKSATEYVTYVYDATGRKLSQQVFGTQPKQTDYIGDMVYEDNVLTFMNHAEGRVIMTGSIPEYQYHIKDHLGNIRVTFTSSLSNEQYSADFESAANTDFQNYSRNHFHLGDHTDIRATYNYSQLLTGGHNSQVGITKSLRVFPGDQVSVEAYVKYIENGGAPANLPALAAAVINAFSLQPGGLSAEASEALNSMFTGGSVITPEMWEDAAAPKAYINYILFDMNYVPYDFGFDQLSVAAKETFSCGNPVDGLPPGSPCPHEQLLLQANVTKPGYIYIYLSNENPTTIDVYFDDLKVEHVKNPVVQMNDYYAFGQTFNTHQREGGTAQNYLYNGKELQDELDVGWLDYGARMYSPEIGRWFVVDPLASKYGSLTPYNYGANNPIRYTDPTGMAIVENNRAINYNGQDAERFWRYLQISARISLGEQLVKIVNGEGTSYGFKYTVSYNRESSVARDVKSEGEKASERKTEGQGLQQITWPDFATLNSNYPHNIIDTDGNVIYQHPSSDNYQNQCAIRLGKALIDSGIDMSSYTKEKYGPKTSEGYPRGAASLAAWLWHNLGIPKIISPTDFENDYSTKTGIIFQQSFHIDIFDGAVNGTMYDKAGSGYYSAEKIWFWEIK